MDLPCPACGARLTVTLSDPTSARHIAPARGPSVDAVAAFAAGLSGRFTSRDLARMYAAWAADDEVRPVLSPKAIGRALASLGWRPWRDSTSRGWER